MSDEPKPCPTCGHPLIHVGKDHAGNPLYHCFRSGTLVGAYTTTSALVLRCRVFAAEIAGHPYETRWAALGCAEAVGLIGGGAT